MGKIVVREYGPCDCEPSEPGKYWLSIEDEDPCGQEYAIIAVRQPFNIEEKYLNRAFAIAKFLEDNLDLCL